MDLQQWFYALGIVFMVVSLVLIVGLLAAVLTIKAKVDHVHRLVNEKIDKVHNVTDKFAIALRTVKHFMGR